jgi:hypothetical protein|uniref:Uncharacterized protein n=1 Tax=Mus musculus TaxID=10090 RepID=Q9CXW6_MOUSE|nr:unnamed protein product [Mus musculus]
MASPPDGGQNGNSMRVGDAVGWFVNVSALLNLAWLSVAAVVSVWVTEIGSILGLLQHSVPTGQVPDGGFGHRPSVWLWSEFIHSLTGDFLMSLKQSFFALVVPMEAIGPSCRANPKSVFSLTAGSPVLQSLRSSTNSSLA